jgi:hypothetical protein
MYTFQTYIDAYLEARKLRIAIARMGRVERAGYHLIRTAVTSKDGHPDVSAAIRRALLSDEVEVAMELFDNFMTGPDGELTVTHQSVSSSTGALVSGEIYVPWPSPDRVAS